MEYVTLIFSKSKSPLSLLIRFVTWSNWSHVGIVDGDKVIEASGKHGVIETPIEEFKKRYSSWELTEAPVINAKSAIVEARTYIGKKYDWLAIFGIWLRTGWDNKDRWVCSELYAQVSGIVRHERVSRFTPEDCWKISKTIKQKQSSDNSINDSPGISHTN